MKPKKKATKKVRIYFIQTFGIIYSGTFKNFFISAGPRVTYIPPALPEDEDSIFAHYKTGINFDKYDDILVEVSGTNQPQAIAVRK